MDSDTGSAVTASGNREWYPHGYMHIEGKPAQRPSVKMELKNDIKTAKQMRLPWWGVLCVIIGSVPIAWLFAHFGRFELARPTLYGSAIFGIAIAIKWKLKRQVWFWITMGVIAALHVLLIFYVPWPTKWVPAAAIVPFGIVDLYAMLAIVSVVGKYVETDD